MKVTGIIAEYNPLHNGHKYQLDKIRRDGSDYIIAVMSGDFTQRGEAAIVDKYDRARMALSCGADLVIELPVIYACNSAGVFAMGGVSMLNSLGVVDELAFGVEEGNEQQIIELARFLADPPVMYEDILDRKMREGLTYPSARHQALLSFFSEDELTGIDKPNTILAIEYCRELHRLNSSIVPIPITRIGSNYGDTELDVDGMSSASAIRFMLKDCLSKPDINGERYQTAMDVLAGHMPESCFEIMKDAKLMFQNDFSSLLHYKLLTSKNYSDYTDITDAFSARIMSQLNEYRDFDSFCSALKTKNITYTSVNRLLTHIMLDMRLGIPPITPYARVLGFRQESSALLSEIKKNSKIMLITKLADTEPNIWLDADILASHIYESALCNKYKTALRNEYTRQLIIM